jgi:glycosyltransferase involved in cell wall biosynthesis
MRIGIDCTEIDLNYKGGVNTYTFGLIAGFLEAEIAPKKLVIFCTKHNEAAFKAFDESSDVTVILIAKIGLLRKLILAFPYILNSTRLWASAIKLIGLISGAKRKIEDNCDLLYVPTTILNTYQLKIPTILSMHDVQQYHFPEFFSGHELKLRRLNFENSAAEATFMQASSHYIKQDLLTQFGNLREEQIRVVPEGVDIPTFSSVLKPERELEFTLPERFLFFPAQLWKHKNHLCVLRALKQIENSSGIRIPLVLTGDKVAGSEEIFEFLAQNDMGYVHYLGKVNFSDLLQLYKKAAFLITAVLYESSSLPALEAAASGTPILASKTPPNIEMSKSLSMMLFNPLDVAECAETIKTAWLMELEAIESVVAYNMGAIERYSWTNIAQSYLNWMDELFDRS